MKRVLSILLIILLLVSGCGSGEPAKIQGESNELQELSELNDITIKAVHAYTYARLLTDKLVTVDINTIPKDELDQLIAETTKAWDVTAKYTDVIPVVADTTILKISKASGGAAARNGLAFSFIQNVYAENSASEWAKKITGQYDATKGANKLKQLGAQLGVDAKAAFKQLVMAQDILQGDAANEEGDFYQKWQNYAQTTKTVCKVGIFVGATIVTAGTSVAAAGHLTLAEATVVVVNGADTIVDVGNTTSNIILGSDHKVSMGMDALKTKLAPVSFVFGIGTFGSSTLGEKMAFIGDNLTDWFYEKKIAGIKMVDGKKDISSAWQVDTKGKTNEEIKAEIEKIGQESVVMKEATLDDLINENQVDLDKLLSELAATMEKYEVENTESPESSQADQQPKDVAEPGSFSADAINGKYRGTAVTVDAKGKKVLAEPEPIEFELLVQGDKLIYSGVSSVECSFDPLTGKAFYSTEGLTLDLNIHQSTEPITVDFVMTMEWDGTMVSNVKATKVD